MEVGEPRKDSKAMDREEENLPDAAADSIAGYLTYIAHLDMPLSAKIEMISALRGIMSSFVDRAFGDDPIQHVYEMRERDEKRIPSVVSFTDINPDEKARSSAFASPAGGKRGKERT
jgi:hypothetical protein